MGSTTTCGPKNADNASASACGNPAPALRRRRSHGACGGVNASLTQALANTKPGEGGFVAHWIDLLDEAREKVVAQHGTGAEGQKALEQEGVKVSLKNLMTFPFVKERVEAGKLKLHGAVFAIDDGRLRVLEGETFENA